MRATVCEPYTAVKIEIKDCLGLAQRLRAQFTDKMSLSDRESLRLRIERLEDRAEQLSRFFFNVGVIK